MKTSKIVGSVVALLFAVMLGNTAFAQAKVEPKEEKKKTKVVKLKGGGTVTVTTDDDIVEEDAQVYINGRKLDKARLKMNRSRDLVNMRRRSLDIARNNLLRVQPHIRMFNDDMMYANDGGAFLGVNGVKAEHGVLLTSIEKESAAGEAGLKVGDVILKIDTNTVDDFGDLRKLIRKHKKGDKVNVLYKRDGKEMNTTATLKENEMEGFAHVEEVEMDEPFEMAEVQEVPEFEGLTKIFRHHDRLGLRVHDTKEGVEVEDVYDETNAATAGLKKQDIITQFNNSPVADVDALKKMLEENKEQKTYTLQIKRGNETKTIEVMNPRKQKTLEL
jgi:serine protease Do